MTCPGKSPRGSSAWRVGGGRRVLDVEVAAGPPGTGRAGPSSPSSCTEWPSQEAGRAAALQGRRLWRVPPLETRFPESWSHTTQSAVSPLQRVPRLRPVLLPCDGFAVVARPHGVTDYFFIHSFIKYLLNTYCGLGVGLSPGNTGRVRQVLSPRDPDSEEHSREGPTPTRWQCLERPSAGRGQRGDGGGLTPQGGSGSREEEMGCCR